MSLLTTEADGATASAARVAPARAATRVRGASAMRELMTSLLIGALLALGLSLLLSVEPSGGRVDLPKPRPRPPLLDQPYRPRSPATR